MKNVHLPGAVPNVGAAQGYIGISVLYGTELVRIGDATHEMPFYRMAYKPSTQELRRLSEGASLILTIMGRPPVAPHRIEVGIS